MPGIDHPPQIGAAAGLWTTGACTLARPNGHNVICVSALRPYEFLTIFPLRYRLQ